MKQQEGGGGRPRCREVREREWWTGERERERERGWRHPTDRFDLKRRSSPSPSSPPSGKKRVVKPHTNAIFHFVPILPKEKESSVCVRGRARSMFPFTSRLSLRRCSSAPPSSSRCSGKPCYTTGDCSIKSITFLVRLIAHQISITSDNLIIQFREHKKWCIWMCV